MHPRNSEVSAGMPRDWSSKAAALADDRVALSKRLGSAAGDKWSSPGRLLAGPPGTAERREEKSRTTAHSGAMDARSKARRVIRPKRQADPGIERTCTEGNPPHECEPARERGSAKKGAAPAKLLRLRAESRSAWKC